MAILINCIMHMHHPHIRVLLVGCQFWKFMTGSMNWSGLCFFTNTYKTHNNSLCEISLALYNYFALFNIETLYCLAANIETLNVQVKLNE